MITEEQIQAVVRRIVEGYQPDRIILFGSYAYGEPTEYSDLDLLVLKNADEALSRERRILIQNMVRSDSWIVDVDIAPLNATEFAEIGQNRFRREYAALQHGRFLHGEETRPARIRDDAPLSKAEKTSTHRLLKSAEQDLGAVREVMLKLDHFDAVARTCQFAAEKVLKARLMSLRAQLPAGHDLNLLLAAVARREHVEVAVWRQAELLAPFAVLFHDYFFTVANPPSQLALHNATCGIYQAFVSDILECLT